MINQFQSGQIDVISTRPVVCCPKSHHKSQWNLFDWKLLLSGYSIKYCHWNTIQHAKDIEAISLVKTDVLCLTET